jgi:hypothetical protein
MRMNKRRPSSRWVAQATRLSRPSTRRSERESASGLFRTAGSMADLLSVPLSQWPNGTCKLPVPPNSIAKFGLIMWRVNFPYFFLKPVQDHPIDN